MAVGKRAAMNPDFLQFELTLEEQMLQILAHLKHIEDELTRPRVRTIYRDAKGLITRIVEE